MSLPLIFLLFAFIGKGQSIDLVNEDEFLPFPSDVDFPDIDGSAVDTCRIITFPTPDSATTVTIPATTRTRPVTKKQVVTTTKRPLVKPTVRKPVTKRSGTPVRPHPQPAGPVRHPPNPSLSLLLQLLNNNRRHAAGSLPGSNRFISQPMGGRRYRGQSSSESDELPSTLLNRAGRAQGNRRRMGSSSSEDSSD